MLPTDGRRGPPLRHAYRRLRAHFGHQHWWPGNSVLEICVGAILVQNTSWNQVERALAGMKSRRLLNSPEVLHRTPLPDLEAALRPAGTFRVKAQRVRAFTRLLCEDLGGCWDRLWSGTVATVRERLLSVSGIGPETADCMLLYAGGHPSFVLDAYTRRVFRRHGWISPGARDADLRNLCERSLADSDPGRQLDLWQDFHAQMVAVGKTHCRAGEARCAGCPLRSLLPTGTPAALR